MLPLKGFTDATILRLGIISSNSRIVQHFFVQLSFCPTIFFKIKICVDKPACLLRDSGKANFFGPLKAPEE